MPSVPYPEWKYRARVDITNAVATANYQHRLNLSWLPGMARDFRDIRFSTLDGTPLYYWEESTSRVTGTSAVVWIKVPTASTKTIYLYYGNGAATDASSGTNTFPFFEHFTSWDTTIWTKNSGNNPTISGSVATFSRIEAYTKSTFSVPSILRYYGRWSNSNQDKGFGFRKSGGNANQEAGGANTGTSLRARSRNDTGIQQEATTMGNYADNAWHRIEIRAVATNSYKFYADDGAVLATQTYNIGSTLTIAPACTVGNLDIDWCLIRNYTATEPTLTIGTHGPNPHFSTLAAAGMWVAAIVAATAGAAATYIPNIMHHRRNQGMS